MYGKLYKNTSLRKNMKKRNLPISIILSIISTSLVSAYYGSYSSFSISNLLDSIDSSTLLLGGAFIISFALFNIALSKVLKDPSGQPNRSAASIISIILALFTIYGINRSGWDIEYFFYNMGYNFGIGDGVLEGIIPLILIVGGLYIITKFRLKGIFLLGGTSLVLIDRKSVV